ncbi:MAG: hypothetical protein VX672_04675 [Planctomycetota bacterium]|nr:hypothetical protein [Planctomycetota bacterium]
MRNDDHDGSDGTDDQRSPDGSGGYELEPSPDIAPDLDPGGGSAGSATGEDRRCQSCGAPMPEDESVMICPSCGYDIVTNRVIDPPTTARVVAEPEAEADASADPEQEALTVQGNTLPWLVAAGVVAIIVAFTILGGWMSFFPRVDGRFLDAEGRPVLDAPRVAARFGVLVRYLVGSGVLVATGVVALRITTRIERLRPSDLAMGASRLALVVAAASLCRLISLDSAWLQMMTHLIGGVAVAIGGTMLVLGRRDRVALVLLVTWALVMLLVVPAARLVSWSLPLF